MGNTNCMTGMAGVIESPWDGVAAAGDVDGEEVASIWDAVTVRGPVPEPALYVHDEMTVPGSPVPWLLDS